MALFETPPLQLLDDREGGMRYWADFVDPCRADSWFGALQRDVAWQAQRRPMYDRVVEVPRLLAAYAADALPESLPLADILTAVRSLAPAPYNAIGLNLYRDGRDSVAMHNDKLHTLVPGQPIALVSLGAPRRMLIRAMARIEDEAIRAPDAGERRIAVELGHGSLLVMSHASQLTHEHGIPKTARAVGSRMSVVFRVRPPAQVPANG